MIALTVGIVLVLFAVYAVIPVPKPWSLGWTEDLLEFLRGGVPVLAVFIGLVAFFVGIADIKDKIEAKKEEEKESKEGEKAQGDKGAKG